MDDRNLLLPLKYRHLFGQALRLTELYYWQYQSHFNQKNLVANLNRLIGQGRIKTNSDYYFLANFKFDSEAQKQGRLIAGQKQDLARRMISSIYIPNQILFIGLSGSVAAGFCHQEDDIDLVIISRPASLWFSRLAFYIGNPHLPHRHPNQENNFRDLLCLNLWLETSQLKFKPDVYTASELLNIVPIYDPNNLYSYWLSQNRWLKNFFPVGFKTRFRSKKPDPVNFQSPIPIKAANLISFFLEGLYMLPKKTKERVALKYAFFHRYDYKNKIKAELKEFYG